MVAQPVGNRFQHQHPYAPEHALTAWQTTGVQSGARSGIPYPVNTYPGSAFAKTFPDTYPVPINAQFQQQTVPTVGYTNFFTHPVFPDYPQNVVRSLSNAPEIVNALNILQCIAHLPEDEAYGRLMGINITLKNGFEAFQLIRDKNIRVEFGDMQDSPAHAQWIKEKNLIMINQKYKGDFSKATLYAISEAVYHEAGHAAKSGDDQSSVQEEIDCLFLNTLANRYHKSIDKEYAATNNHSELSQNGTDLYPRLFFDRDPMKKALIQRIINKYGMLPLQSQDHPVPRNTPYTPLAYLVLQAIHDQRVQQYWSS